MKIIIPLFFILMANKILAGDLYQGSSSCSSDRLNYTNSLLGEIKDPQGGELCPSPEPSLEQTEAAFCDDCSSYEVEGSLNKIQNSFKNFSECLNNFNADDISPLCFYAGMLRSPNAVSKYYRCPERNRKNPGATTGKKGRLCFTEDYVSKTAQAFNTIANCLDFSKKEKQDLFTTLNHESAFNLNASSPTGARCYGQMTFQRFKDLNKYIYYTDSTQESWPAYHLMYRDAVEKCPLIKRIIVPPEMLEDVEKKESLLGKHNSNSSFTCTITRDPYTCFFYSMYNLKVSQVDFNKYYDENPEEHTPPDFPHIERNEMIILEGSVYLPSKGRKAEVSWTLKSDSEVNTTFVDNGVSYNKEEITIKKVELFDKDILEKHFSHTAHNGGHTIAKKHFVTFMRWLKGRISRGSSCMKQPACKRYREKLVRGEKLTEEELREEFRRYAIIYGVKNRESRIFMTKADEHVEAIQNPTEIRNNLQTLLKERHPEITQGEIDQFTQNVSDQCFFANNSQAANNNSTPSSAVQ